MKYRIINYLVSISFIVMVFSAGTGVFIGKCYAQTCSQGIVWGQAKDTAGKVLPFMKVQIGQTAATADSQGRYVVYPVLVGSQSLKFISPVGTEYVMADGSTNLQVAGGDSLAKNLVLKVRNTTIIEQNADIKVSLIFPTATTASAGLIIPPGGITGIVYIVTSNIPLKMANASKFVPFHNLVVKKVDSTGRVLANVKTYDPVIAADAYAPLTSNGKITSSNQSVPATGLYQYNIRWDFKIDNSYVVNGYYQMELTNFQTESGYIIPVPTTRFFRVGL